MKLPFIMSKLRELSERMDAKRYASSRRHERKLVDLQLHPAAKSFNMKLPIIMKSIGDRWRSKEVLGCQHYKLWFMHERPHDQLWFMNDDLARIIKMSGDVQKRKTNVKADMTDWFMQRQYPIFNFLADIVIDIAKKTSPHEVQLELYDNQQI